MSLLILSVNFGHIIDRLMDVRHELTDGISDLHRNGVLLVEELGRHRHEGFLRPLVEPVNAGAVHHSRELSASDPESAAHRRETQHHLQLFPHSVYEELPAVLKHKNYQ